MNKEFADALAQLLSAVYDIVSTMHLPEQHEKALKQAYARMTGAVVAEALQQSKELLEIQDSLHISSISMGDNEESEVEVDYQGPELPGTVEVKEVEL